MLLTRTKSKTSRISSGEVRYLSIYSDEAQSLPVCSEVVQFLPTCSGEVQSVPSSSGGAQDPLVCSCEIQSLPICSGEVESLHICSDDLQSLPACSGKVQLSSHLICWGAMSSHPFEESPLPLHLFGRHPVFSEEVQFRYVCSGEILCLPSCSGEVPVSACLS